MNKLSNCINWVVNKYSDHLTKKNTFYTLAELTNDQLEDIGLNRLDIQDAAYNRLSK